MHIAMVRARVRVSIEVSGMNIEVLFLCSKKK